jgi:hypothetical protein
VTTQPKSYYFYHLHDLPTPEEFKPKPSPEQIV